MRFRLRPFFAYESSDKIRKLKFDYVCGALSLVASDVWIVADSPILGILLAATADIFVTIPTVLKAWKYPETETLYTYFVGIFGSPGDVKLKSLMTLFGTPDDANPVFQKVLDKYYNGEKDRRTLELLGRD
jgi:hypothetical protein